MKKALFALLFIALSLPAFAEGHDGKHQGPPPPEKIVSHMTSKLDLTDEQASQILQILESKKPQTEASREQHRELRQQIRGEISAVLTEQQREKFEAMHQQRMAKRKQHHEKEQ
jgi:Spy/CpxP family protein refolding chaperone